MNETTKFDLWMNGGSRSVRLPLPVAEAFKAKCANLHASYSQGAKLAIAGSNAALPEAITAWVKGEMLYATRETWIGKAVELFRPIFAERGHPLPDHIRATIAFTSKGWRGKRRGECWSDTMSADGATEIMVCLRESDTVNIVNILCHELCHAAQYRRAKEIGRPIKRGAGHGKTFGVIATAMDLTVGKASCALGDFKGAWGSWAQEIVDALGPCPHAAIAESWAKKEAETPKQGTRMLKLECAAEFMQTAASKPCGAIFRMSSKHIADKKYLSCPCCGATIVNPHFGADEIVPDDLEEDEKVHAEISRVEETERHPRSAADTHYNQLTGRYETPVKPLSRAEQRVADNARMDKLLGVKKPFWKR